MSRWVIRGLLVLTPLSLFALALFARAIVAGQVPFPATEPSAYYVGVARNLVEGHGLISDVLFSYATPPLTVPHPAFELWQPLATFAAAIPMQLFGATFASAQLSSIVLGALVAPLTWFVALDVALREDLPDVRAFLVAVTSGIVVALLGTFLIADVAPESTTAFTCFALLACWLMTRALPGDGMTVEEANRGRVIPRLLLGLVLGLAYLARWEAIFLVPAYLVLLLRALGPMRSHAIRAVIPTFLGGIVVVAPWLVRNYLVFGTIFPGSAIELMWLTRNEQVFAYTERPTLAAFLNQGPVLLAVHMAESLWRNLLTVLVIPAMPVGIVGIISLLALRRSAAVRAPRALRALLLSGLITFVFISVVFPVTSAWGTYRHAAGPFLVGLTIVSMLGLDAFVAAVRQRRHWPRANAWLAPVMAMALALPFASLQVNLLAAQTQDFVTRLNEARDAIQALPATASSGNAPIISDHPMRLSEVLRRPTLALPDEPSPVVWRLARRFGSPAIVVMESRGRYPDTILRFGSAGCFQPLSAGDGRVYVFAVAQASCGSVGSR